MSSRTVPHAVRLAVKLHETLASSRSRVACLAYALIHRLDTVGGIAPTTGCDADHVGAVARVDYTTTYVFYRAGNGCG
jgi:hypothetical protein